MGKPIGEMTEDEFQQYWISLAEQAAEKDPYEAEILKSVKHIIDNRRYSHLFAIMKNYDHFAKFWFDKTLGKTEYSNLSLPYWCYGHVKSKE